MGFPIISVQLMSCSSHEHLLPASVCVSVFGVVSICFCLLWYLTGPLWFPQRPRGGQEGNYLGYISNGLIAYWPVQTMARCARTVCTSEMNVSNYSRHFSDSLIPRIWPSPIFGDLFHTHTNKKTITLPDVHPALLLGLIGQAAMQLSRSIQ